MSVKRGLLAVASKSGCNVQRRPSYAHLSQRRRARDMLVTGKRQQEKKNKEKKKKKKSSWGSEDDSKRLERFNKVENLAGWNLIFTFMARGRRVVGYGGRGLEGGGAWGNEDIEKGIQ